MTKYISGVILYDETIWQKAKDGTPLVKLIEKAGVDPRHQGRQGRQAAAGLPGEVITEGLDGLARAAGEVLRARRHVRQVARGDRHRRRASRATTAIKANAHALARYAALCQAASIVPIVEPEVLMDGDHDIDRCYEVTTAVLKALFEELYAPARRARRHGAQAEHGDLRQEERQARRRRGGRREDRQAAEGRVPAAVPGIAFLSGGQSDEEATAHLDAMNKIGRLPWKLTFSYGRALQAAPQKAWAGKAENVAAGAARLRPPRADERPRRARPVEAGPGEEGGVTATC